MYLGYMYLDPLYIILVIPAVIIAAIAQANVSGTFSKYSKVRTARGYTGAEAARAILDANGLYNVRVERVAGNLSDHFDPRQNVIRLSQGVYDNATVAAVGVAAHESGHAVQYATGYAPIKLRNAIVPITQFGSSLSIPVLLLGFFMGLQPLVYAGIILFSAMVVFQLVTLPVEFNASSRALAIIEEQELLGSEELRGAKKVLGAAALTYVAALLVSLMQLLRIILRFGSRRRD
ncbi:zinc metallopeptidase [Provencibacterium massiliense]|uniref:zinc metallopeptidase n=1 Tax=Provencibacterium massiliense TaxID=1841868 RepID=UPI00190E87C7|nr:zinc metallopeptidase [Provencibacterium massiliense]